MKNRPPSQTQEHRWQRNTVQRLVSEGFTPVLNVACKEDPACLADFGATNLDIQVGDPSQGITSLADVVPNFVNGDATKLSEYFQAGSFGLVMMGEMLEHLLLFRAIQVLSEVRKVLKDDGRLALSFPLDPRPFEAQHNPPVYTEFIPGCFASHITVWKDDLLAQLYAETGFREVHRDKLTYILGGIVLGGRGLILEKA